MAFLIYPQPNLPIRFELKQWWRLWEVIGGY